VKILESEKELAETLAGAVEPGSTVIVGLGSELRCDDALGVEVASALAEWLSEKRNSCAEAVAAGPSPEAYFEPLLSKSSVIFVDAVKAAGPSRGFIFAEASDLSAIWESALTHGVDVARVLVEVGKRVYVVGAPVECLEHRVGMSRTGRELAERLARALIAALEKKCSGWRRAE